MENQKERKILTHVTQSYKIFLFLFLLFGGYGNANEYLPIINVAEKWSASHNDKSINSLQLLYANKLNYYNSDFTRKKVLSDKKRFFNKYPHFSHNIQNIKVSSIGREQYLIEFDKYVKVNSSNSDKKYPSYLLLQKFGDKYKIIFESDKITDKNLEVKIRSSGLYRIRSSKLNVRDEPHKSATVLSTLKKNDLVHIDIFLGKWGKSNLGWISGRYLTFVKAKENSIDNIHAVQDKIHLGSNDSSIEAPGVYEVTTGELNIRVSPGKLSKIVTTVKQGDRITIYEFSGKWGKTDNGWISSKYLKLIKNIKEEGMKMEWYYWIVIVVVLYFVLKKIYELRKEKVRERKRIEGYEKASRYRKERAEKERIKKENRITALMEKYKDHKIVDNIMNGHFWIDGTEEQILDSLGQPLDIDSKVTKTKRKETWKYDETGKNRYNLKIDFENGLVIGWEDK